MLDQGDLSAMSWRTVTVRMFNSQVTPKLQDLLLQMDAYKSIGPRGIHSENPRDAADVTTKPVNDF